jgi:hypothetical protein
MPSYLSPGVYVEEVASGARPIEGVGTSVAAFVGLAPTGPLNEPTLVTNWSQYVASFGEFTEDYYLAHAVYGFFNNGGSTCYVVRVGGTDANSDEDNGTEQRQVGRGARRAQTAITAATPASLGSFSVAAIEPGRGPLAVEVADAEGEGPADRFRLVVKEDGKVAESFDVTAKRGSRTFVVTQVRERSKLITVTETETGGALVRPTNQTVELAAPTSSSLPADADAPESPGIAEYIGDSSDRTGFGGLEAIDEITMVAVPDLMAAYEHGAIDEEALRAGQQALIAHCELMGDRVAIIDPPPGLNARDMRQWRQNTAGYDSNYAALYYPWIKVFDPKVGKAKLVPPSGHMAGVWSRNDAERGVHKAPANEVIRGAVDLGMQITRGEQDVLNPIGVNCIRAFPGRGIRVWGARTLSSDPAWRYLNVRRYFNYLEESILTGTQWVVFEPNDGELWARIRRNVSAFLINEWRNGALFGSTAEQSFYVKCDEATNPPESVNIGRVICEIGVAPVKPAEFVIFRLAQVSGGGSELEE